MSDPFLYVIGAACLLVLVILALGISQFGRGGAEGRNARTNSCKRAFWLNWAR